MLGRTDKIALLTPDRCVDITAEAAAKAGDATSVPESIFSAALLPVEFFRDVLRGHAAKGMFLGGQL